MMEIDAVKLDAPNSPEQSADYWRERAECLEEWVCELLRKNQTLRMDLEKEESRRRHRDEGTLASSLVSHGQSPSSSARQAFRTEPPRRDGDAGSASCFRKECAEIRESVIHFAVMTGTVQEAVN
jgi:hypothetical protein